MAASTNTQQPTSEEKRAEKHLATSVQISRIATEIAASATRLNGILADSTLQRALTKAPGDGSRIARNLAKVITSRHRLGCAPHGGSLARSIATVSTLTGGESLAAKIAATALRLRIAALAEQHPEFLEDPDLRELIDAIEQDRQTEAVQLFTRLKDERGTEQFLGDIAPLFIELTGLIALLDENPFNDAAGWAFTTGENVHGEPLLGVSMDWISTFEKGNGNAERVPVPDDVADQLLYDGSIASYMENIATLQLYGYIMIHRIATEDGTEKFLIVLPGMTADSLQSESTQDTVGAIRNAQFNDSTYMCAMRHVFADAQIPNGAQVAIIGHSQGGLVGMNLAADTSFRDDYELTHIICIGSPVDQKKPRDPQPWVASITNHHDIVPTLDGRGPGSPYTPHPDWFEVRFSDPAHGFPACHGATAYTANLRHDIPDEAAVIDQQLAPYRGTHVQLLMYKLSD